MASGVRAATQVELASLAPADSPRLAGENAEHIRALADLDGDLPPILVHRHTMRVIDGMHRLRAAERRCDEKIDVEYFEGDEDAAFILAVEANIAHGLPLSLADRQAAAARIIAMRPQFSDRAIAASAGLSAGTVGALRRRSTVEPGQLTRRVGRDGRARPLDTADGRQRASELLAARPNASLREIARDAGIAAATVRDVRERMRRGEGPIPGTRRAPDTSKPDTSKAAASAGPVPPPARRKGRARVRNSVSTVQDLKKDPSLKFSDPGRHLLRWLDTRVVSSDDTSGLVDAVPAHCADLVAEVARGCAEVWQELAEKIEQRTRQAAPGEREPPAH